MPGARAAVMAIGATLVLSGVGAPMLARTAGASVGAAPVTSRSVGDDSVLGVFSAVGNGHITGGRVQALALQGDDRLFAGGAFTQASDAGGTSGIAALSFADDEWRSVGGGTNDAVYALATQGDDTVYVGGAFTVSIGSSDDSYMAAWSTADDTWHSVGGGVGPDFGWVRALSVQGDDSVHVGGSFTTAGGVPGTNYVATWSTADDTWHPLGDGTDYSVLALASRGDDTLYAGGGFTSAGSIRDANYVAAWSATDDTWHGLAGGVDNYLHAIAVQGDGTLLAGGAFTDAGGKPGADGIAAWSNADDTWHPVGGGVAGGFGLDVSAFAIDDARGLVYVGGSFTTAGSADDTNVAVWDSAIAEWIPLQAAGGNGVGGLASHVYAIALDDSVVYLGGDFRSAGGDPSIEYLARWTWNPPSAEASPSSGEAGRTIQLRGSGLVGVTAVRLDGAAATYTRDDSTTVTVTIPGGLSTGSHPIAVDAVGGTATTAYEVQSSTPPLVDAPGAPTAVSAVAGVAAAAVSWTAPMNPGSYPISGYQVTAAPGGRGCLVTAPVSRCEVTGLVDGTSYTFIARALSGAGWGTWSAPSNAVTPTAPVVKSIVITGSRDAADTRIVRVSGRTTGLAGERVTPWIRFAGQGQYAAGFAITTVDSQGGFDWQRKASKKTHVYFASGTVASNRVTIPARLAAPAPPR